MADFWTENGGKFESEALLLLLPNCKFIVRYFIALHDFDCFGPLIPFHGDAALVSAYLFRNLAGTAESARSLCTVRL